MPPESARIALLVLGILSAVTVVPIAEEPASTPSGSAAIHQGGTALEDDVIEATRAFLRQDSRAARRALDALENHCRQLKEEDGEIFGADALNYDRAYHTTLTQAREDVSAGKMDDAFNQFVWVQRTCTICHRLAGAKAFPAEVAPSLKGESTAPNRRD